MQYVGREIYIKHCPLSFRTFRRKVCFLRQNRLLKTHYGSLECWPPSPHPHLGLSPKITRICFWSLSFTFKCTLPKQFFGRQWLIMLQMQYVGRREVFKHCPPSFRTWPQMLLHLWLSIQYKLLVTNTLQIDMINHRSALKHEEKFIWETPRHFVHICQLSYVSGGRNCTYAVKWGKSDSDVRWTTKRRKCLSQSCQA